MLRLKFKNTGTSFKDLNNPFYLVVMSVNNEYQVCEETPEEYYFKSSPGSLHKVNKKDPNVIVLDDKVARLVYVLFENNEETDQYFLNISEITYPILNLSPNHEYKLMWKLI